MIVVAAIILLFTAHYVADFAMQNDYVATAKAKVHTAPDGIHALTAHAFHHFAAALVALLVFAFAVHPVPFMAVLLISAFVGVTHWMIDYGKAVRGWYGYHVDQLAHLVVATIAALVISLPIVLV